MKVFPDTVMVGRSALGTYHATDKLEVAIFIKNFIEFNYMYEYKKFDHRDKIQIEETLNYLNNFISGENNLILDIKKGDNKLLN
jgi:hypothetical protein